jgi:hypothetical protein
MLVLRNNDQTPGRPRHLHFTLYLGPPHLKREYVENKLFLLLLDEPILLS